MIIKLEIGVGVDVGCGIVKSYLVIDYWLRVYEDKLLI